MVFSERHWCCWAAHSLAAMVLTASVLGPSSFLTAQSPASDTVYIWDQERETESRVRGTIRAYDNETLTLTTVLGREQQVPSAQVSRLESRWDQRQLEADKFFAVGEFGKAEALYRQALQHEMRPWARHRLMAQVSWSEQAAGQWADAGNTFVKSVLGSNPRTPYFAAIPLHWKTPAPSPSMERFGKIWLVDEQNPAANLLGASWLLASLERDLAIQVLKQLAVGKDRQIAFLAEAQLWRIQVPTVSAGGIEGWEKMLERMPPALRAGPSYLLGHALRRTGREQDALIAWMRVPLQYPRHRLLAAESLLATARYYQATGKSLQATTLYRELAGGYGGTIAGQAARDQLQKQTEK